MMKIAILFSACLFCMPALAQEAPPSPFEQRIGAANTVYMTADGVKYLQAYEPLIGDTIQACIPPGTKAPGTLGKFTFVADVTKTGVVTAGAVRPQTSVSQCFDTKFSQHRLPPPPLPANAKINYPIVIEMNVVP